MYNFPFSVFKLHAFLIRSEIWYDFELNNIKKIKILFMKKKTEVRPVAANEVYNVKKKLCIIERNCFHRLCQYSRCNGMHTERISPIPPTMVYRIKKLLTRAHKHFHNIILYIITVRVRSLSLSMPLTYKEYWEWVDTCLYRTFYFR